MSDWLLQHEPLIRVSFFIGIFAAMAYWELRTPRRFLRQSKWLRWGNNIGIVFLNTALLRFLFPTAAVGVALLAEQQGWGLFNYFGTPTWIALPLAVVIMDGVIYFQHVLFHAVPGLWRLHRMHHTDLDLDVTSGSRFHPIEILLSMLIKLALVVALGAPAVAVLIFEIILNGMSMFNHSNVRMPQTLDRVLRWLIVTPDMHRVHHSRITQETNSNYGFNLSIWDRLLGTYKAQPELGHENMEIGLREFTEAKFLQLHWMLIQPLMGRLGDYPINLRRRASENDTQN